MHIACKHKYWLDVWVNNSNAMAQVYVTSYTIYYSSTYIQQSWNDLVHIKVLEITHTHSVLSGSMARIKPRVWLVVSPCARILCLWCHQWCMIVLRGLLPLSYRRVTWSYSEHVSILEDECPQGVRAHIERHAGWLHLELIPRAAMLPVLLLLLLYTCQQQSHSVRVILSTGAHLSIQWAFLD